MPTQRRPDQVIRDDHRLRALTLRGDKGLHQHIVELFGSNQHHEIPVSA